MGTFITNEKHRTLRKRLELLIKHSEELKFLVGFFYFSGWQELFDFVKERDDLAIKVLVGLDVDRAVGGMAELELMDRSASNAELTERFFKSLGYALNTDALDTESFYEQVSFFVDLIQSGRLVLRKTLDPNHAKLYLFKLNEGASEVAGNHCRFITGSSNLTRAGIRGQHEFNVEIGDYGTNEAEEYFDSLWKTAVHITEDDIKKERLIRLIQNETQVASVSPFEAYVLVLKTYLEMMQQKTVQRNVLQILKNSGYMTYSYQVDAVNQALTIIDHYGGVIVADVVGLGKSIIAGMIAKSLGKRGIVLCPPGLIGDRNRKSGWRMYLDDFKLHDWEVRSVGDLEGTAEYLSERGDDIEVVIVDEVHRFRNQDTGSYEFLHSICRNRILILLSATPFNNTPADIFSLLKLFIVPGKSRITLDDDLEMRFASYSAQFRKLSFILRFHNSNDPDKKKRAEKFYQELFGELPIIIKRVVQRSRRLAIEIRQVLEPVVIRRNRIDLRNDPVYRTEITELSTLEDPKELFFSLNHEQSVFYDRVVNEYFGDSGRFKGAIYQPFWYEKRQAVRSEKLDEAGNRAFQQQRNLFDFMRRLLVKRFESSFGAFKKSIQNFIRVHGSVLAFIENSGGKYILDRKLIEKIYENDPDEIEEALKDFEEKLRTRRVPKHNRIYDVHSFEQEDEFLNDIQGDLDLLKAVLKRVNELSLVDHDPKLDCLVENLKKISSEETDGEPRRKIVIFTEYVDTVKHLKPTIEAQYPGEVLVMEGNLTGKLNKKILENFDAAYPKDRQKDTYRILLTSDKLSEGVNLNRAGAIINYDIPWNPTRVIQRVGRINRIGKKVFDNLFIYNFFPTEQGANVIQSREIARQKMFLIHNTLGEDAKIFNVDETPSASELYSRINSNPEDSEEENLFTRLRKEYKAIKDKHSETIERVSKLPARVKTAKAFQENQLVVYRRKGLGLFVHAVGDTTAENLKVEPILFNESLSLIECEFDEPAIRLSSRFWNSYEKIKTSREHVRIPRSEAALETKALNNLKSALQNYNRELNEFLPFIQTLIEDLKNYKTLSKYTLRRISSVNLKSDEALEDFKMALTSIKHLLGENYLERLKQGIGSTESEVIIAVENISSGTEVHRKANECF